METCQKIETFGKNFIEVRPKFQKLICIFKEKEHPTDSSQINNHAIHVIT